MTSKHMKKSLKQFPIYMYYIMDHAVIMTRVHFWVTAFTARVFSGIGFIWVSDQHSNVVEN